jgi:hypothetical protein
MGMEIRGGMVVGEFGFNITPPNDMTLCDWVEENGLDSYPQHYDAPPEQWVIGFSVDDVQVFVDHKPDMEWFGDVLVKANKFEGIAGVPAKLIGTPCVW